MKKAYGELERSHKELERVSEAKSRFLSAVSHEFRTSLVVIRSYADIISQKRMGEVNEMQRERLRTVVKQADYLGGGPGPVHRQASRGGAGRNGLGQERTRHGKHLQLHASARASRGVKSAAAHSCAAASPVRCRAVITSLSSGTGRNLPLS